MFYNLHCKYNSEKHEMQYIKSIKPLKSDFPKYNPVHPITNGVNICVINNVRLGILVNKQYHKNHEQDKIRNQICKETFKAGLVYKTAKQSTVKVQSYQDMAIYLNQPTWKKEHEA